MFGQDGCMAKEWLYSFASEIGSRFISSLTIVEHVGEMERATLLLVSITSVAQLSVTTSKRLKICSTCYNRSRNENILLRFPVSARFSSSLFLQDIVSKLGVVPSILEQYRRFLQSLVRCRWLIRLAALFSRRGRVNRSGQDALLKDSRA
jgi:hypothetical protein